MRHYFSKKMAEATKSQESTSVEPPDEAPNVEAGAEDVASEVQQVQRILEIKNMDWERHLSQAVSVLFITLTVGFLTPLVKPSLDNLCLLL